MKHIKILTLYFLAICLFQCGGGGLTSLTSSADSAGGLSDVDAQLFESGPIGMPVTIAKNDGMDASKITIASQTPSFNINVPFATQQGSCDIIVTAVGIADAITADVTSGLVPADIMMSNGTQSITDTYAGVVAADGSFPSDGTTTVGVCATYGDIITVLALNLAGEAEGLLNATIPAEGAAPVIILTNSNSIPTSSNLLLDGNGNVFTPTQNGVAATSSLTKHLVADGLVNYVTTSSDSSATVTVMHSRNAETMGSFSLPDVPVHSGAASSTTTSQYFWINQNGTLKTQKLTIGSSEETHAGSKYTVSGDPVTLFDASSLVLGEDETVLDDFSLVVFKSAAGAYSILYYHPLQSDNTIGRSFNYVVDTDFDATATTLYGRGTDMIIDLIAGGYSYYALFNNDGTHEIHVESVSTTDSNSFLNNRSAPPGNAFVDLGTTEPREIHSIPNDCGSSSLMFCTVDSDCYFVVSSTSQVGGETLAQHLTTGDALKIADATEDRIKRLYKVREAGDDGLSILGCQQNTNADGSTVYNLVMLVNTETVNVHSSERDSSYILGQLSAADTVWTTLVGGKTSSCDPDDSDVSSYAMDGSAMMILYPYGETKQQTVLQTNHLYAAGGLSYVEYASDYPVFSDDSCSSTSSESEESSDSEEESSPSSDLSQIDWIMHSKSTSCGNLQNSEVVTMSASGEGYQVVGATSGASELVVGLTGENVCAATYGGKSMTCTVEDADSTAIVVTSDSVAGCTAAKIVVVD